jgi:hypothetical protein
MVIEPDERAAVPAGHRATHLLDVTSDHVRVRAGSLRTGDHVALVVEGFLPFRATVTWTTTDEAGLDFLRPIHSTMVHHLARFTPRAE